MEHIVENSNRHSISVKSLVIFDTETTGLQSPGNNPHITELCFVALTREELLTKQRAPRVLNKLLICFNPCKRICHKSSVITGLYNDALDDLAAFRVQAQLIIMFLKNLPQPACLIAHNGNCFDFPLLVSHLKCANEEVPEGILCADSLEAFRTLDGLPPVPEYVLQRRSNKAAVSSVSTGVKPSHIDRMAETITNNRTTGGMNAGQTHHICSPDSVSAEVVLRCKKSKLVDSSDYHKRTAYTAELVDPDMNCKQVKLVDSPDCHKETVDLTELVDPDMNCKQVKLVDSPDCHKETVDLTELVDPDMRDEEIKLSSDKNKVWGVYDHTPQKHFSEIAFSDRRQSVSSPDRGSYEIRNQVRRQLFESDCIDKELQLSIDENCLGYGREEAECGRITHDKTDDTGAFSVRGVIVGNATGLDRNITDVATNTLTSSHTSQKNVDTIMLRTNGVSEISSGYAELGLNRTGFTLSRKDIYSSSFVETCNAGVGKNSTSANSPPCVGGTNTDKFPSVYKSGKEASYSLPNVYLRLFGQPPEVQHTAEDDCSTLLKIIHNKMSSFSTWLNKNAVPLKSVSPMY